MIHHVKVPVHASDPDAPCEHQGPKCGRTEQGLHPDSTVAEERLRKVAEAVLELPDSRFGDDQNGPGDFVCVLCCASVRAGKWQNGSPTMPNPLKHTDDCPIVLARAALAGEAKERG